MGTLLSDLRRAFGGIRNAAPVPMTPTGMTGGLFGGRQQRTRGAELGAMELSGTIFSVVSRITTAMSAVEWHLYRSAKSGRDEDRVEVTKHAALDLIEKPNAYMASSEFVEATQQHEELTGEQWWVIYRSPLSPIPLELWPVRPDRMEPVPGGDFLLGYEYTSPDGDKIPLGLDEVIFTKLPNPRDPYRGLGPVGTLLTMLDAVNLSQQWNRNLFLNGAEPGGIIKISKRLSQGEWEEKQKRWADAHRGVSAAHKVAIIEGDGIDWIPRAYSPQDMQFGELRLAGRDQVYEAWGVSGSVMGVMDGANRAIADSHKAQFAEQLTLPRAVRRRTTLNTKLLPMYGPLGTGLEFDFDSPVPSDELAEATVLAARALATLNLRKAGYDGDDVLNTTGLPPMRTEGPADQEYTPEPLEPVAPEGGR